MTLTLTRSLRSQLPDVLFWLLGPVLHVGSVERTADALHQRKLFVQRSVEAKADKIASQLAVAVKRRLLAPGFERLSAASWQRYEGPLVVSFTPSGLVSRRIVYAQKLATPAGLAELQERVAARASAYARKVTERGAEDVEAGLPSAAGVAPPSRQGGSARKAKAKESLPAELQVVGA